MSSSSSSLCRRKRSRVFLFFIKKTSFRLNEEKNFSLINKLIYIHFYSHLSFFLLEDLSAPLLRETVSKRERYAEDESAKKADWGARRVEFDRD